MTIKIEHRPTERVLNILEALASSPKGLTFTEIALAVDAPRSSLFPFIHTLAQRKFIYLDEKTHKYSIGIAAFCVGAAYTGNMNTLEFIKIEMKNIVNEVNEICQMGIIDKGEVLYIAKVDSDNPIRIISSVGKRLPAYCTALGKAMLSQYNIEELKKIYPKGLKAYTEKTVSNLNVLESQLKEIRKTNIAFEEGEINEPSYCFATPLYKDGRILASISVSVPSFRMTEEKNELIKRMLLEAKAKIETFFKENDIEENCFAL